MNRVEFLSPRLPPSTGTSRTVHTSELKLAEQTSVRVYELLPDLVELSTLRSRRAETSTLGIVTPSPVFELRRSIRKIGTRVKILYPTIAASIVYSRRKSKLRYLVVAVPFLASRCSYAPLLRFAPLFESGSKTTLDYASVRSCTLRTARRRHFRPIAEQ